MRKYSSTLFAIAAMVFATGQVASAADMPMKAAPLVPQPIAFSWTGFYGGIHAGYGWSDSTAHVSDNLGIFDPAALSQDGNGVIGGVQVGYNWQLAPNWVIGVEGDFSGSGIRSTTNSQMTSGGVSFGPGFSQMAERDIKWLASARARLGYAADRWLVYVTGGGAWGGADYTAGPIFAGLWSPVSFSHTSSGWTAGGGVEYGFTNNWTGRVEYLFYDLDGVSISNSSVPGVVAFQNWDRNRINVVRAGVNYKF